MPRWYCEASQTPVFSQALPKAVKSLWRNFYLCNLVKELCECKHSPTQFLKQCSAFTCCLVGSWLQIRVPGICCREGIFQMPNHKMDLWLITNKKLHRHSLQYECARSSAKFNSEFSLFKYLFTFLILTHLHGHSWDAERTFVNRRELWSQSFVTGSWYKQHLHREK